MLDSSSLKPRVIQQNSGGGPRSLVAVIMSRRPCLISTTAWMLDIKSPYVYSKRRVPLSGTLFGCFVERVIRGDETGHGDKLLYGAAGGS